MKILIVAGARPNFVKVAPLVRALKDVLGVAPVLVHTGQHYEAALSARFFEDLDLPRPDHHLDVGSGSHAAQTAQVMERLDPVLAAERPDVVIVVGDVNSTVAAALTAVKRGIKVAHVEAGLRSFDRSMPEEINRIVTDAVSDLLFVSEISGLHNLLREGVDPLKVRFVGNVMIDALETSRPRWSASDVARRLGIDGGAFGLLTLHRPSNVDDPVTFERLLGAVRLVARRIPVLYPVHPRVRGRLETFDGLAGPGEPGAPPGGLRCVEPLGYIDFVSLMSRASLVLTDSGGIQEETTALGVPCLTLRTTTERPVTTTCGTNRVVGTDPADILSAADAMLSDPPRPAALPPLWDGQAAHRIALILGSANGAAVQTRPSAGLLHAVAFP